MARRSRIASCSLVVLVVIATACGKPADERSAAERRDPRLQVYVVNYPLKYFAQRIGGSQVVVELPAPRDSDPAFWSPDAATVAAYQRADLILLNGAGYAGWVDRMTLPPSKIVNTSRSFADRYIVDEEGVTHSHGPEGDHSHGAIAFTTWLDPTLAVQQARAILAAFTSARPEGEATFRQGFDLLERDLAELDDKLGGFLKTRARLPLLTSHPVYQYLGRRYDLNLVSVHFEPNDYPDERAWRELAAILEVHPAEWMFWEAEPLETSADRLRQMGVESVVFDPSGNEPPDGDYLTVMRDNLNNLVVAFTEAIASGRR